MRQFFSATLSVLCLIGIKANAQDGADEDQLPVIARSGSVEIQGIEITRARASYQSRHADLTKMAVALWLSSEGEPPEQVVLNITELEPIHDNTGKLLSTPKRLAEIPFLKKDVRSRSVMSRAGSYGPMIKLQLEAPARDATTIKLVKGKAVVAEAELVRAEFKNLSAIKQKVLDDPKLKDFKIEADVSVVDGQTEVKLIVPADYDRLVWWGLVKNTKREIAPFSEGHHGEQLEKTYQGDQTKGSFLGIVLAEPGEPHELEFEFKDIELP